MSRYCKYLIGRKKVSARFFRPAYTAIEGTNHRALCTVYSIGISVICFCFIYDRNFIKSHICYICIYMYSEVTGRQFFLLPGTDSAPGDQIQNWAELVLVAVLYYHLPGILDPPL